MIVVTTHLEDLAASQSLRQAVPAGYLLQQFAVKEGMIR
jgi:hypothetical protein